MNFKNGIKDKISWGNVIYARWTFCPFVLLKKRDPHLPWSCGNIFLWKISSLEEEKKGRNSSLFINLLFLMS
jgi:hypothetical protein